MAANRVRLNWVASNGAPGGVSTLYVGSGTVINELIATLQNLVNDWAAIASDQWQVSTDPELQTFDEGTGQLLGVSSLTSVGATGALPDEPVADATAGLARYFTGSIVNGHRVRGRTFLPGLSSVGLVDGQWDSATLSGIQTFANRWASLAGSSVWARPAPSDGRLGTMHAISSAGAWAQCAVLRSRRQR